MFKRLIKVMLTEWKLFFTDPAAILILVVASIFYAFYYPTPYIYQTATKIPVAVVDLDNSAKSRELIRMASATQQINVRSVYSNILDAENAMANENIYGFMVIPKNIETSLSKGYNVNLDVFTHGAYVMMHGNIATAFTTSALTLGATTKVKQIALTKKVPAAKAMAMRDPIPINTQTMFNSSGSYSNYVVPSVLVIILQQTLIIGICALGGSRAHRKFRKKARESVVENEQPMIRYFGRALAYLLHYSCFIIFYHFVVYSIFDFPRRGALALILLFAFVFFSSVINFGMILSQLFLHRETSMQIFVFTSIPLLFISNFSWPSTLLPTWLKAVSYISPSTLAVPAWIAIEQRGADIYSAAYVLYPLALQAIFYLILGVALTYLRDNSKLQSGDM